ncbi:MAG: ribonuclease P protein component [Chloroflexi bacterium]|nr:ribonuclease P protein component [Chloroflexota bacterium]MCH8283210.1 ribonuclease P protein component [Chloroflexota bacterium]MCI0769419.1 ribonuclease P protein component [Chloroflexota bacterium]
MQQERRLRRKAEFALIQREGRRWSHPLLILRALPNDCQTTRFGFVVSRRVGKAVVRNRVKRRLREIARCHPIDEGWDVLFIAKNKAAAASFADLRQAVQSLLRRGRLCDGRPSLE